MIVTKIEAYSGKSKFSKIYADGEYLISLPPELIERFKIEVGAEIDEEELKKMSEAALVRRARERLLYSLDRRLHSEKELRDKLRQNYPPHIIDAAISELIIKGVDKQLARSVVDELTCESDDEYKSALAVAERYKKDLSDPKGKQRLYGALARRGFSYSVVKRVMQEICNVTYYED